MERMENEKDLKIPENASDREDYIQGIGAKELYIIGVAFLLIVILVIILYVVTQSLPGAIFAGIFLIAFVIMLVKRDSINENMIDKLRILFRYLKMQKRYEYVQFDVFGGDITVDEQCTEDDGK